MVINTVHISVETRTALLTHEAARHLGRRPQTLRWWACTGRGPNELRPFILHGRLMWPVAEIQCLLGVKVGK